MSYSCFLPQSFILDLIVFREFQETYVLEGFNQFLEKAKTDDPSAFVKAGAKVDTQGSLEGGSVDKKPMTLAAALHEQYDK